MAAVPAMDGLAQRVTNRTRCFNSCWLDSNVETARTSMHHLRDAAVRGQDEFMHVLLYVASLIATPAPRSQPSTQSAEEPNFSTLPSVPRPPPTHRDSATTGADFLASFSLHLRQMIHQQYPVVC